MTPLLAGRRIGLLTAHASRRGGGVAEAVLAQAAIVRALGAEPIVFALSDDDDEAAARALAPTRLVVAAGAGPAQLGYAPAQRGQLLGENLDLLHLHGIWMHPSRAGAQWATATARPYVISPHGMLDPWITARGRWKKALARIGYERTGWARAAALHALTPAEAGDIARETGRGDTLVIPNAGPAPDPSPIRDRAPGLLYLGRIHPKKNLAGLVRGWQLAERPQGARLIIAGWGDAADVAALEASLAAAADPSIAFVGPAFGEAKHRLLAEARFLMLPSFSEGLPMVILESWAAATPTIMTEACHLPEGFAAGGALRCATDERAIAAAITHALALDARQWRAMATAARELAEGPFSAGAVARRWEAAYARLLGRGGSE